MAVIGAMAVVVMAQDPVPLADGTPVAGLTGERWTSRHFSITVPAGQTLLTITATDGKGTSSSFPAGVALFVKQGSAPTPTNCTFRSGVSGNNERVSVTNPAAGDWFILLYATTAYSNVTLTADYADTALPSPPTPVLALASVFSDHLVLQRGQPVPVWGMAKPGDTVTVTLEPGGSPAVNPAQTLRATADAKGAWRVDLAAMKASEQPMTLKVVSAAGDPAVTVADVLVGEVWVASGQSNMEWPLSKCTGGAEDIAAANDPQLRMLTVPLGQSDVPRHCMPLKYNGSRAVWTVASAGVNNFSGVAYYFAHDLRKALGIPVGVMFQAVGGTTCRTWSPLSAFDGDSVTQGILANWQALIRNWTAQYGADPAEDINRPMALYNAIIAPLPPYAIRGVIWYQGESDAGNAAAVSDYRHLFPALIKGWRREWGGRDFPFYFVQLASGWAPELREVQLQTWQSVTNTAMVVTTDVGTADGAVHPPNKKPVGERLALAARALSYGEAVEYSGPVYESFTVANGTAVVRFTHARGLKMADGGVVRGFTVAGEDGVFASAEAVIEGSRVIVRGAAVAKPVAVRYGWAKVPECNLVNGDGLPASPFRTDAWPAAR